MWYDRNEHKWASKCLLERVTHDQKEACGVDAKQKKDKRLRNIWSGMRQRCNNPNHLAAPWYHDKGIRVCPEWEHDFFAFQSWALEHGYENPLTIDRIDSDKGYSPDNCRWITRSENSARANRTPRDATNVARKPGTGRFMVVEDTKPFAPLAWSLVVVKTGLSKREARLLEKELSSRTYPSYATYSVGVTDGHKEGDKMLKTWWKPPPFRRRLTETQKATETGRR